MANTIKLKRGSGSDPSASDLSVGELAVRTDNGKLFTKKDDNSVAEISGSGGGVTSDAQGNIAIGVSAGDDFSGTDAENNILIGKNAGTAIDTADRNIAIGTDAIKVNTGQSDNVAVGHEALKNVTRFPTSGGAFAWYGTGNSAVGSEALTANTTGYANTALGYYALASNVQAFSNTACGYNSLTSLSGNSANKNTAIGEGSGYNSTTATQNLFAGWASGYSVTSGQNNTLVGHRAGLPDGGVQLTTGSNNLILGNEAASSSATVSNEITLGNANITKFRVPGLNFVVKDSTATEGHVLTVDSNGEAGFAAGGVTSDAQGNTVAGTNAGDSFSGTSAISNTLIGKNAGTNITTGDSNIAIGNGALASQNSGAVTGTGNIALGFNTNSLTSGYHNIHLGMNAGYFLTEGYYNIAIGRDSFKVATTASENICLGFRAGTAITTAANNTILGSDAANTLTTGSNCLVLGHNAQPSSNTVSNEITLGDTSISKFRVPALNFVVKSSTATEGHVLTVDANGEAGFAAASGGGPTGGGSDKVFTENAQTVTTNYTIGDTFGAACNAMAAGPIAINSGITVTIDSGDTLTIV